MAKPETVLNRDLHEAYIKRKSSGIVIEYPTKKIVVSKKKKAPFIVRFGRQCMKLFFE